MMPPSANNKDMQANDFIKNQEMFFKGLTPDANAIKNGGSKQSQY